jgi:hypothetical protein
LLPLQRRGAIFYIWRERDTPVSREKLRWRDTFREAGHANPIVEPLADRGDEAWRQLDQRARGQFPSRADKGDPRKSIARRLSQAEDLHSRAAWYFFPGKASLEDPRVVHHQEIPGPQKSREVIKNAVRYAPWPKAHKTRAVAPV